MAVPHFDLIIQKHDAPPLRHPLADGESTIGRSSSSDIAIKHPSVSREHARVTVAAGGVTFENLTDAEGSLAGGVPVSGPRPWLPGETIRVGEVSLTLEESRADSGGAPEFTLPMENRSAPAYEEGKEIARGGMGAIYSVRDAAARRVIALKRILGDADGRARLRFIDEAQITAQLEHPNIVPVHEVATDAEGRPYYTMKLVKGITLKKIIELLAKGAEGMVAKYPLGVLLTIFQKVCDAVAFAHSRGIIHRDLKPANIMVGEFGEVLVMDWGLAKKFGASDSAAPAPAGKDAARIFAKVWAPEVSSIRNDAISVSFQTQDGAVIGTPHYMAPEQAAGRVAELDARTDIFALGGILCHLLVLQHPFPGTNLSEIITAILSGEFIPPAQRVKDTAAKSTRFPLAALRHLPGGEVPQGLDAVCRKSLAHEPAQRYQGVAELQADLQAFQDGFATGAENASAWTQLKLLIRRNQRVATAIAASLALIAVLSGWYLFKIKASERTAQNEKDKAIASEKLAEANEARAVATLASLRKTAPVFVSQAQALIEKQDFPAALEKIEVALELAPESAAAHVVRGDILQSQLRLADARAAYDRAFSLDAKLTAARESRDLCAALLREYPGTFDKAALSRIHAQMARQNRTAEAIALLRQLGGDNALLLATWKKALAPAKIRIEATNLGADGLFTLNLSDRPDLDDISALRGMPLRSLTLTRTRVSNLSPLKGAPLQRLDLDFTPVKNLEPLRGANLRKLNLEATEVTDIAPLAGMPLESLSLRGCKVRDISPLKGMPLVSLNLKRVPVGDISALEGMPLVHLDVSTGATIRSLTALAGMQLKTLEMSFWGSLEQLKVVQGMPLESLVLYGAKDLYDISFLRGLPLKNLYLSGLKGTDLSPLSGMKLESVNIEGSAITSLEPLRGQPLATANLSRTKISDFGVLAGWPVTSLDLEVGPALSDLGFLRGKALKRLNVQGCKNIRDLTPLAGMPLETLFIGETGVESLAALAGFNELRVLAFPETITDIEILRTLPKLAYIARGTLYARDATPAKDFWREYDAKKSGARKVSPEHRAKLEAAGMPPALAAEVFYEADGTIDVEFREIPSPKLEALAGLPIKRIELEKSALSSIEPLRGLQIEILKIYSTPVSDISPLRGMTSLKNLQISGTQISDLTPLAGLKLTVFRASSTPLRDISVLRGMPLEILTLGKLPISDISLLKDCHETLRRIHLPKDAKNYEFLRDFPNLERIGFEAGPTREDVTDMTAEEFWAEYDAKNGRK